MSEKVYSGLFVSEGSSDLPLADLIEALFLDFEVSVRLSKPDFGLLPNVAKTVKARVEAGLRLVGGSADLIVVHRDADSAGPDARRREILEAVQAATRQAAPLVPVIPVRMTEAWLLLNEAAIRQVAGNPRGRKQLGLPKVHQVESVADPKDLLGICLLTAADENGRRREAVRKRFNQHRRQLLERLDRFGPVTKLQSWQQLVADIKKVAAHFN